MNYRILEEGYTTALNFDHHINGNDQNFIITLHNYYNITYSFYVMVHSHTYLHQLFLQVVDVEVQLNYMSPHK